MGYWKCIEPQEKPALVLSAGGMFGAYQAGVWQALAGRWKFDLVVGASSGALNAWAIACGMSGDELVALWLQAPAGGRYDSRSLTESVRRLVEFGKPRIQVGVVATELPRFKIRLFRDGEIGPEHLAASCAVPLWYPQVRIGDRWYTDGGITGPLPLWAAAEMGATRVLAINVLAQPPSRLLRLAVSNFRRIAPRPPRVTEAAAVTVLTPSVPLGNLRDAVRWRKEHIARSIELGRSDAERLFLPGWP
jgi:NTE family protein